MCPYPQLRHRHRQSVLLLLALGLAGCGATARANYDDGVDHLREHLTFASAGGTVRARVSGRVDLTLYHEAQATADLRYTEADSSMLFSPVARVFADVQLGPHLYAFAQLRADRGFDPAASPLEARLEEFSVRYTPMTKRRFSIEAGRFATIFGSWTKRHLAWEYPFITAPPAQETLLGLWDSKGAPAPARPAAWAHLRPLGDSAALVTDERRRIPVQWGPAYTTGVALRTGVRSWDFATELKNVGLSARPSTWDDTSNEVWQTPALAARLGWRPSKDWTIGASWAHGVYLAPRPEQVFPGAERKDYTQTTLGADLTYEHRHLLVWGEVLGARFEVPGAGAADTLAATLESRYKFNARWAAALRLAWQGFREIETPVGDVPWGREVWRVEGGPVLRLAAQAQLKLLLGLRHEPDAAEPWAPNAAAQLSLRF